MSMSCNNYSESQSYCTDDTLGVVITSDFDFSSGYSSLESGQDDFSAIAARSKL